MLNVCVVVVFLSHQQAISPVVETIWMSLILIGFWRYVLGNDVRPLSLRIQSQDYLHSL